MLCVPPSTTTPQPASATTKSAKKIQDVQAAVQYKPTPEVLAEYAQIRATLIADESAGGGGGAAVDTHVDVETLQQENAFLRSENTSLKRKYATILQKYNCIEKRQRKLDKICPRKENANHSFLH